MEPHLETGRRSLKEETKKHKGSKKQKLCVDEVVLGQHEVKKPKTIPIMVQNRKKAKCGSLGSSTDSDKVAMLTSSDKAQAKVVSHDVEHNLGDEPTKKKQNKKSFSKPIFEVDKSSADSSDEEPHTRKVDVLPAKTDFTCSSVGDDSSSESSSDEETYESNHIKQDAIKKFNDVLQKYAKRTKTSTKSEDESKTPFYRNEKPGVKTLFVGNLSFEATRDDVLKFFERAAEVVELRLATSDGTFRGFGHAVFATEEGARKALGMNGEKLLGRPVRLAFSQEGSSLNPLEGKEDGYPGKGWKGPGRCVFVKGFAKSLEEEQIRSSLKEHFGCCGEIVRVSIPQDHKAGCSKGFAYLLFDDPHSASKALGLNGTDLGGHTLKVEKPKGKRDSSGGMGSGVGKFAGQGLGGDGVGTGPGGGRRGRGASHTQNGATSRGKKKTFSHID